MLIDSEKLREYMRKQREYQLRYNSSECYISILGFIENFIEQLDEWELDKHLENKTCPTCGAKLEVNECADETLFYFCNECPFELTK